MVAYIEGYDELYFLAHANKHIVASLEFVALQQTYQVWKHCIEILHNPKFLAIQYSILTLSHTQVNVYEHINLL